MQVSCSLSLALSLSLSLARSLSLSLSLSLARSLSLSLSLCSVVLHVASVLLSVCSEIIVLEHAHRSNHMSSSENDGLSSEYVDSDEIHRQDLLHSSDFERSSESAHIDDNSEDIMSAGSSGGRELESAELWSNQTRNPVRQVQRISILMPCHIRLRSRLRHQPRSVVSG